MTRPAEAIAAARAVIADRYATAASMAATEATHAATMTLQHGRVQNITAEFVGRAQKAERTGEEYEQTLQAGSTYGQMAGIVGLLRCAGEPPGSGAGRQQSRNPACRRRRLGASRSVRGPAGR